MKNKNKKKYYVEYTEKYVKSVEILAETPEEAFDIAKELYYNEDIFVDENDYVGDVEIMLAEIIEK